MSLSANEPGVLALMSGMPGLQVVTPHVVPIGASQSGNIPAGAKNWSFTAISGTVTLGGQTVNTGISLNSQNKLGANLPYTTAAASTAFLYYET